MRKKNRNTKDRENEIANNFINDCAKYGIEVMMQEVLSLAREYGKRPTNDVLLSEGLP